MRDAGSSLFIVVLAISIVLAMAIGASFAGTHGAAFGMFAALTIGGALICLFERSILRSAFALLATLLGTAGLFLLLESDFLAMTQALICVGAVLAMILLGVLSGPVKAEARRPARIFVALLAIVPLCGWFAWKSGCADALTTDRRKSIEAYDFLCGNDPLLAAGSSDSGRIGVALVDPRQYAVAFEVAALLLVVALVAAVSIARKPEEDAK